MRIVDRATFLAMPAGTVYAKFEPMIFGDIAIKGESIGDIDFRYSELGNPWFVGDNGSDTHFTFLEEIQEGAAMVIDYSTDFRDGLFDADQLFAVWERADVEALIARLQETLT